MTPARVWADAYTRHYQYTLRWCRDNGYDLNDYVIHSQEPVTVAHLCRMQSRAFADLCRTDWLEANPNWLEELTPASSVLATSGPDTTDSRAGALEFAARLRSY